MAILKVANMGHPVLRRSADPVTAEDLRAEPVKRFIADLIDTMREYDGVGLAAPQVHESVRIIVIESHRNPRYPEAPPIPLQVLVNPEVEPLTEETGGLWEGCLSIPGIKGWVERPAKIRVRALDASGAPLDFTADDFTAIVIQHETDHVNGILFLDRMKDLTKLAFQSEYERYHAAKPEDEPDEGDEAPSAEEPS